MTDRKPPGVRWESWIDKMIREGQERGDFDNLPGTGKPLADVDRPRDPDWWIRKKLAAENVSYLPPTLAVRKDLEDTRTAIAAATREVEVRRLLDEINEKIRKANRNAGPGGPPSTLMPLDVEAEVAAWHRARDGAV